MPSCALCGSVRPAPIAKRVGRLTLRQAPGLLALQPMNHQWSRDWGAGRHPLGARARMVRRADSSSASVSPATRMIRRRPWRMIRPGRLIREKRSAFMRRATHAGPSTSRFITAFRLWARIMSVHHAALAPNSPLGIRPPARSVFMTAWTSSLLPQRSRSHQITWSPGSVRLVTMPNSLKRPLAPNSSVGNGNCAASAKSNCRKGSRIARKR